ncbi:hypothetical protein BOO94_02580 [Pseudomonas sp. FSL W5-0299]|nr:hypothetical protein BOO94_02580 [Pseudomonas sp. FSL W5-0299]
MVSALAGKTRTVAIDVTDSEVGSAFLYQPAQQPIRFLSSTIDGLLFGQSFHGFEALFGLDWAKDLDNHQSSD